jgi:hypothetical protein
MSDASSASRSGGGVLQSSPAFTPAQSAFFRQVADLVTRALGAPGNVDLTPLQQLTELVIHQRAERSHTDTVAVLQHVVPDLAAQLQSMHAAKVKTWLLDFMEHLIKMDASPFLPHVLTVVTSMTAEDKSVQRQASSCAFPT